MQVLRLVRVFVVDDDEVVADLFSDCFRQEGFRVEVFHDSAPALKAALESPPDVVVTDFELPSFDGLELARRLKEHCPSTRILLISGRPSLISVVDLSATLVLEKPIALKTLVEAVRQLLKR